MAIQATTASPALPDLGPRKEVLSDLLSLAGTAQVVRAYAMKHGINCCPTKSDPDIYGCIRHMENTIEALIPRTGDNNELQTTLRNNKALLHMVASSIGEMEDEEVTPACAAACDALILIADREHEDTVTQEKLEKESNEEIQRPHIAARLAG